MLPRAKLSDLIGAIELDSPEYRTYFDRQKGKIVSVERTILGAFEDGDEERFAHVPDWEKGVVETARAIVADDGQRFIHAPAPYDFHEYRHMERFIGSLADEEAAEQLWRAIKGRGAFRYFKDTLYRLGLQDQWYQYREEAMKRFVIEWAEAHNVAYEDDLRGRRASAANGPHVGVVSADAPTLNSERRGARTEHRTSNIEHRTPNGATTGADAA